MEPPTATRSRSPQVPRTCRSAPRKEATGHDPHHPSRGPAQAVGKATALDGLDLALSWGQVLAVLVATANQWSREHPDVRPRCRPRAARGA
jgi:hypothetical protein